jgi:hypothetical protein
VQRITGALLLAIFAVTQSGWAGYLHMQEHAGSRQAVDSRTTITVPGPVDHHDERTCAVCMTLHMPLATTGCVLLLICLGLLLAFLTLLTPRPMARQAFGWIESRGPPAV